MSIFYTTRFYDRDLERTSRSASAIVPYLVNGLATEGAKPLGSVIDIGCGRGVWLRSFAANGVSKVAGRDGPWTGIDRLLIDPACFTATDLSQPFAPSERFDLAMSLEVAEHIDAANADCFVDNLVQLSDTILFSAAIGGQGGQHHVNEQPLSYWLGKFRARGYQLYDVIRPRFWANDDVCWWYRQNMVVFCNTDSAHKTALDAMLTDAPAIVDLVHPAGFSEKARLANLFSPEEYVGLWVTQLKKRVFG